MVIENTGFFKFFIIFFILFISNNIFAQFCLKETDLRQVPQKKVRFYIANQIHNNVLTIADIQPSVQKGQDVSNYWTHEKTYQIQSSIDTTWHKYSSVDLRKIWSKKPISFGLLLSKKKNKAIYKNDPFEGVEVGQVYYLNLQFLKGIYNIAVAFEILTIDNKNKVLEFSYINDGVAKGMQSIYFQELENGVTEIIHKSIFKSEANFRDKYLYPLFHKRFINEFHYSVNS